MVNTQTALLLAELNDQSQREDMSIYYTQTQIKLDYTELDITTATTTNNNNESIMNEENDDLGSSSMIAPSQIRIASSVL